MRLGSNMSGQRTVGLAIGLVLVLVLTAPARVRADSIGTIVVTGKVAAHERMVIESGIVSTVRKASWSLSVQPFAPKDVDTITKCLRDDQPWRCLSPLMQPRGVDRIIVAEATPQADKEKLVIVGEFVTASGGTAAIAQKRCDTCNEAQLEDAAKRLAEELLRDMTIRAETALALQTSPPGSSVSLDGQPVGITDATGKLVVATYPGPHRLVVQHDGFLLAERTIDLPVAKTTPFVVELAPGSSEVARPQLVPAVVAGAGVVALGVGIALQATKDSPPVGQTQSKYDVSGPGVALMVVGGAAIGTGVYLWLRNRPRSPASVPTATLTRGGALVGWAREF